MDCRTFQTRLRDATVLDADAAEHALTCATCAEQLEHESWTGSGVDAPLPPPRLSADEATSPAAVRSLIARDRGGLGRLRALPMWVRVAIACSAVVPAIIREHRGHGLSELWLHAAVFVAATVSLLWPLHRFAPAHGRGALAALTLVLPFAFALFTYATHAPHQVERPALPCLSFGLLLSVPFWATLCALDRRGAMGHERALLAGAAAGLVGNALMHLHCASTGIAHLMASHALLGAIMSLAAWALMSAWSRRAARIAQAPGS